MNQFSVWILSIPWHKSGWSSRHPILNHSSFPPPCPKQSPSPAPFNPDPRQASTLQTLANCRLLNFTELMFRRQRKTEKWKFPQLQCNMLALPACSGLNPRLTCLPCLDENKYEQCYQSGRLPTARPPDDKGLTAHSNLPLHVSNALQTASKFYLVFLHSHIQ